MARKRKLKVLIYALLALFLLVVTVISGRVTLSAFADTVGYTSVLEDLTKDDNFKVSDYPDKKNIYSISVIQIAESTSGELFVYTYQACQKTKYLVATKISMALTDKLGGAIESDTALTEKDKTKLYDLMLINSSGVFCKYKVNDFTVSGDKVRFYNITEIFREWLPSDGDAGNDNIKKEKYFKVGKLYTAETVNGSVKYTCKNVDTVEIKNPYVDFVSYGKQSAWDFIAGATHWTDIHYIAFSTDKKIDTLKEADVTYTTQSYHYEGRDYKGYSYGEKSKPQYLTLTSDGEIGLDFKQYIWKSISRTEDFVKSVNLTGEAKTEVEKSEFVLVFLKTAFEERELWSPMQGHYKNIDGTKVSDVTILRLMFETDGVVYNLGALMDIQEGDDVAGNKQHSDAANWLEKLLKAIGDFFKGIWSAIVGFLKNLFGKLSWWQWLLVGIAVIACIVFIISLIKFGVKKVFEFIGWLIKKLCEAVWWIISLPFRAIGALFKRNDEESDE